MRQWRLIYDSPTAGIYNMAIDEAVLRAGSAIPTLRLYAWTPPCLSLGYAQPAADVDRERLRQRGWDLVRRPTGGRAILHIDELTYSLTLPEDHPVAQGGIIASYRRISHALLAALSQLGVSSQADQRAESGGTHSGPVCFETPSHYEVTAGGKKLIGSAQMRRQGMVLQHGSLPLFGDIARICDVLAYDDEAARGAGRQQVRARATTLAEALPGSQLAWAQVAEAVVTGFMQVFDVTFNVVPLSAVEAAAASDLAQRVYGSPDWTYKR